MGIPLMMHPADLSHWAGSILDETEAFVINRTDHWYAYVSTGTGDNRVWWNVCSIVAGTRNNRRAIRIGADNRMAAELRGLRPYIDGQTPKGTPTNAAIRSVLRVYPDPWVKRFRAYNG